MADYKFTSAGNISAYATKLYNITLGAYATALPTHGDNVYANNYAVNLDVSVDIGTGKFSTEASGTLGVTGGGSFNITNNNVAIIGDRQAGASTCHNQTTNNLTGISWMGNIYGSNTTAGGYGFMQSSTSPISNIGTYLNAGAASTAHGAMCSNSGTVTNTYSSINGGAGTGAYGVFNNSSGTVNNYCDSINGANGTTSVGAVNGFSGVMNNYVNSTINGGSTQNAYGAYNASTGRMNNFVGLYIQGGSGSTAHGAYNLNIGQMDITCPTIKSGTGDASHGAYNLHKLAVMNIYNCTSLINTLSASTNNNSLAVFNCSTTTPIIFTDVDFSGGIAAAGNIIIQNSIKIRTAPSTTATFRDYNIGADYPPIDKVQKNYVYGNGDYTGTLDVTVDLTELTQAIADIQIVNSELQTTNTYLGAKVAELDGVVNADKFLDELETSSRDLAIRLNHVSTTEENLQIIGTALQ